MPNVDNATERPTSPGEGISMDFAEALSDDQKASPLFFVANAAANTGRELKPSHSSVRPGRSARFATQRAVVVLCPRPPSHPDGASPSSVPVLDPHDVVPPTQNHQGAAGFRQPRRKQPLVRRTSEF